MIGIYKIVNPNGKLYIGQSTNVEKRWRTYKTLHCKGQIKLYNSLKKHGFENHKFEIIEECDVNMLDKREIYWGEYYDVLGEMGLNCRLGNGKGKLSEETKQKISESNIGKEGPWKGKKNEKYSEWMKNNNPFKGKTHTNETKEKIGVKNSKPKSGELS